jgi:hypothetical protein
MNPRALRVACLIVAMTAVVHAQERKKNPTSKFFVADLNGDAQVDTGREVSDLTKKSVYNAEGTVVETKPNSNYAMVYSNGTGAYFDPNTRVEIKEFSQEPFRPNRTDMDVEPSVSQTQAYVSHGSVGLCLSKLVAGSSMTYSTPQGSVTIQGRKIVIDVSDGRTTFSMIEGDSTVQGGDSAAGHMLHDGQQAVITAGPAGQPPTVTVQNIPGNQKAHIEDKVSAACVARRTVYFEVVGRKGGGGGSDADGAAGSVFEGAAANAGVNGASFDSVSQQIIAVPVVPSNLPTSTTVSPAFLPGSE